MSDGSSQRAQQGFPRDVALFYLIALLVFGAVFYFEPKSRLLSGMLLVIFGAIFVAGVYEEVSARVR